MVAFSYDLTNAVLQQIGIGEKSSFIVEITVGTNFKVTLDIENPEETAVISREGVYPLVGVQTVGITFKDENGDDITTDIGYADVSGVEEIVSEFYKYGNRVW